jgi:hypothetical protein
MCFSIFEKPTKPPDSWQANSTLESIGPDRQVLVSWNAVNLGVGSFELAVLGMGHGMIGKTGCTIIVAAMAIRGIAAASSMTDVNDIAQSYVKLVLQVGLYDPPYVDAYFGPAEWKPSDANVPEVFPAERLRADTERLIKRLGTADDRSSKGIEGLRLAVLRKQLIALRAKINLLSGAKMSFDEESKALYDVVAPAYDPNTFQRVIDKIDNLLPGEGSVTERFNRFRDAFTIPRNRLESVLTSAIDAYHGQTRVHLRLPANENCQIQFVSGQPWGAALTYKGDSTSLIAVNRGAPLGVTDVVEIAGHELYPGHHAYMCLQQEQLYKDRGWVEYCVWPLCSPRAIIAEGLAEYGCKDLLMTPDQQVQFYRSVLLPTAGFDPNQAQKYCRLMALKDELNGAVIEAARRYLDGRMDRGGVYDWLERYYLTSPGGASAQLSFIEQFRSYIVTYAVGRDIVKRHIETRVGSDPTRRWQLFYTLLSTPGTASSLAQ